LGIDFAEPLPAESLGNSLIGSFSERIILWRGILILDMRGRARGPRLNGRAILLLAPVAATQLAPMAFVIADR
jgi:hypothetical protein